METQKNKPTREELTDKLRIAIKNNATYKTYNSYLIDKKIIAKRIDDEDSLNEYSVAKYLFEKGVNVPETYGVIKSDILPFKLVHKTPIDKSYITFEKIAGTEFENLEGELLELATKQYKEELEKVLKLGICPETGTRTGRPVFSYDKVKTYLTDFRDWHVSESKNEIQEVREQLKFIGRL